MSSDLTTTSIIPSQNLLGEGPVWHPQEQKLYWVDLFDPMICVWDAQSDTLSRHPFDFRISATALCDDGFVLMSDKGFLRADAHFHVKETYPFSKPLHPQSHANDGAVDRRGRFWAGTATGQHSNNHLFRLDGGTVTTMAHNIGISNGIAWSPDNTLMYYVDSPKRVIYVYDYDISTGNISNRRNLVHTPDAVETPDGITVDIEGYIWCAQWDGWRVTRYAPDGTVDLEVEIPVQRPTSCTFGGDNLDKLYVTSAHIELTEEQRRQQPLAGNVFCIETDTRGFAESFYNTD